jgi:hypothetical protein
MTSLRRPIKSTVPMRAVCASSCPLSTCPLSTCPLSTCQIRSSLRHLSFRTLTVLVMPPIVLLVAWSASAQETTVLPREAQSHIHNVGRDRGPVEMASTDGPSATENRNAEWRADLAGRRSQLAEDFESAGRSVEAQQVRDWGIEAPSDRQLLFLHSPAASPRPQKTAKEDELVERFRALRIEAAQELYREAASAAEAGHIERAYQWLFAALRENPDHAAAKKIVGIQDHPVRVAAAKTRHHELKWKAGSYWRAHSDHFTVTTNHSRTAALAMAELLEDLHQVWRQLFVRHWTTPHAIRQAFAGRALVWPTRRRHDVVLFADRAQFVKHLKTLEPQIEMALGVYRDKDRTTYFYEGEADLQSTWLHEATHQLFQETVPARPGAGANDDFWMIEAVAMYIESTRFFDDHATVGGNHAARLEVARHRALKQGFYVPLHVLSEFGKRDLQQHDDIRRLYTQSAGFAHFLMDSQDGRFRREFVSALSDLYRRPGRNDPLWERLELPSSKLDAMYVQFLRETAGTDSNRGGEGPP